jgi:hypothetical protein
MTTLAIVVLGPAVDLRRRRAAKARNNQFELFAARSAAPAAAPISRMAADA